MIGKRELQQLQAEWTLDIGVIEKDYILGFKDNDVLMLYDPRLDGIEDPEDDIGRQERVVNLHPKDWFTPFSQG